MRALNCLLLAIIAISAIKPSNAGESEISDLLGGGGGKGTSTAPRNLGSAESTEDLVDQFSNSSFLNSTEGTFARSALPSIMDPDLDDCGPSVGPAGSAVILAGVFVILAIAAFGGMLVWRKRLQIRYGNSAMLITEDAYDFSDLRNFEI